ncbi:hypothetical protein AAH979_14250 [Plantactinospora sp. ZYX-F-223]|uniref:hypothetical protein n=1 Tax=Plantactinospora sp. ZYX-F-223 TaxID=3144103 RepID=UPI0031FE3A77
MSKRRLALWTLPLVAAASLSVWVLLDDPGTRLGGMILLAAMLGFAGVFVIPVLVIANLEGRIATFRDAPGWALLLAGIGLTVGVLACMGWFERGEPEYVWRYGEPGQVEVNPRLFCTQSRECDGSWTSDGTRMPITIRLSDEEFERLRGDGVRYAGESGEPIPVDARILADRATSVGFGAQPDSSVALGRIPGWLGWAGGGIGLAGFVLAAVYPRRRHY